MREFFHGWRRKTGCITLVCALILVAVWVRGLTVIDEVRLEFLGRTWMISTGHGFACFWSCNSSELEGTELPKMWLTFPIMPQYGSGLSTQIMTGHWTMSYWPPTMGLTLLSAYLILWPGKRVTKPTTSTCGEHDPE